MNFLLVAGLILVVLSVLGFNRLRQARNTYRSKVKSAPQGLVEVEGYVWPLK